MTVLCRLDDIEDGKGKVVPPGPEGLLIVRRGDHAFAWRNSCPHANLPLGLPDGRVLVHGGTQIVCPVHGASFDAVTGICTGGPAADDSLTPVAIDVVDGEIRLKDG
ncbi:Rieske (2Fe-2S) protein [Maricaulis sp.]|uniref:Rieske (2Fe-2S) protein n=1 Tax=Maricaulis sp. TaxID=1486257 RepID=UPI0026292C76|nr:Rieske (2Fe-2S) protein [Maricaulis sp.]